MQRQPVISQNGQKTCSHKLLYVVFRLGLRAGQMEAVKNFPSEIHEFDTAVVPGMGQIDFHHFTDFSGTRGHNDNTIGQIDRLIHIMGDKDHGCIVLCTDIQQLILESSPGKGITRSARETNRPAGTHIPAGDPGR